MTQKWFFSSVERPVGERKHRARRPWFIYASTLLSYDGDFLFLRNLQLNRPGARRAACTHGHKRAHRRACARARTHTNTGFAAAWRHHLFAEVASVVAVAWGEWGGGEEEEEEGKEKERKEEVKSHLSWSSTQPRVERRIKPSTFRLGRCGWAEVCCGNSSAARRSNSSGRVLESW